MSSAAVQVYGKAELWRAYREAFHEFARRMDEVESLKANGNARRTSVERALFELERARVHYRQCRDALASVLLQSSGRRSFAEDQSSAGPPDDQQHVREIAQMLWELEARREGFADDDWYRAEEIIRGARAASCDL